MKAILTAAWAAIVFITSLPASAAQPESTARSVSVDYSDLDLTRAQGVSTLEHRVNGAIRQVCDGPAFGLNDKLQQHACARSAQTAASRSVQTAITTARQLPSAKSIGTITPTVPDKTISNFSQQLWISHNRIPRR